MAGTSNVNHDQILAALREVMDPDLRRSLVSLGLVRDIDIDGGRVQVSVDLGGSSPGARVKLKQQISEAVAAVRGVEDVEVKVLAGPQPGHGHDHAHGHSHGPAGQGPMPEMIPGVKHTIAVTSGKGGVGKSTVAVNLAVALKRSGAKVGLLDADVYGPSIPTMFGVEPEDRPYVNAQQQIVPLERDGMGLMSIGFLVERDAAMIMRGPMLAKYVQDALSRVDWGELDYLVIDLPPGTGDVQLTLSQTIPLDGAVVVTTPQKVALADVRRAITMCEKLNVPVLGIVENMSDPTTPDGQRMPLFGHGGGQQAAQEWGFDFLGEVPFDNRVPLSGDEGRPIVVAEPDTPAAQGFGQVAERVAAKLSDGGAVAGPSIQIED